MPLMLYTAPCVAATARKGNQSPQSQTRSFGSGLRVGASRLRRARLRSFLNVQLNPCVSRLNRAEHALSIDTSENRRQKVLLRLDPVTCLRLSVSDSLRPERADRISGEARLHF